MSAQVIVSRPEREAHVLVPQRALRVSQPPRLSVVAAGPPGPLGPPGPPSPDLHLVATTPISGHRAVRAVPGGAAVAGTATAEGARVIGIAVAAVAAGELVTIRATGELVEPSWAWAPGPIYLAPDGALTQIPPSDGAVIELGVALTPTSMLVRVLDEVFDAA